MLEYKLSKESAQAQIDTLFDWYGIEIEDMVKDSKSEGGTAAVDVAINKLKRAIRRGIVEVTELTENDEPTLHIKQTLLRPIGKKESITYHELTGNARAAMRSDKTSSDTARMYEFLGIISKEDRLLFRKLRGADIGITDTIGFVFLLA